MRTRVLRRWRDALGWIALLGLTLGPGTVLAQVTLSASPTVVAPGATVTVTWAGISSPTSTDWVGLFELGAANNAYVSYRYTTGTASGSVPFTIPAGASAGVREFRIFPKNSYTLLATSNTIT